MIKISKKKIRELLDKNLKHAGFVKQPYGKFDNLFLDKLISQNDYMYRDLRKMANLSRAEMAKLVGLSENTIYRYEESMDSSKVPKWYYIMLRLVNGDLSFFGNHWIGIRIQHHDRKLKSHYSQEAMSPMELYTHYNQMNIWSRAEARNERQKSEELQNKIKAYEEELASLRLRNEILNQQISELKAVKALTKTGKVVSLFVES